ncbi:hypothetical protein ACS0TY_024077 [Phlomoides rotata]
MTLDQLKLEEQQFLGEASCTLSEVLKSQLFVDKYSENIQHTFLDYVAGGYELNFMVAIDSLTGGNGKFRQVL